MNSESLLRPLIIEPVTEALLPQVVDLDRLSLGGLWTIEGYRREVDSPNSDLLLLKHPGSLSPDSSDPYQLLGLGCLWAILDEAHITLLAIHPHYQRQGLGQTLLYALLVRAWTRGLARATLEVRASNQPALTLYTKFGFQEAGRRRHYYQDTGEDALVLWRGGLQHPHFPQTLLNWQHQILDRLSPFHWTLSDPSLESVGF